MLCAEKFDWIYVFMKLVVGVILLNYSYCAIIIYFGLLFYHLSNKRNCMCFSFLIGRDCIIKFVVIYNLRLSVCLDDDIKEERWNIQ